MKLNWYGGLIGVAAIAASSFGQNSTVVQDGPDTFDVAVRITHQQVVSEAIEVGGDTLAGLDTIYVNGDPGDPRGCNDRFYDSGDATNLNSGRTVGGGGNWAV